MILLLIRLVALGITVWITTLVVPGIEVDGGPGTYFVVAAVLATVNAVIGTVLRLFTLPLILVTLGIFSLVISAWMLMLTDWLMETLTVDGFTAAFLAALVIAISNVIINAILLTIDHFEESRHSTA